MKETWKPIHLNSQYEISSLGRVRSYRVKGKIDYKALSIAHGVYCAGVLDTKGCIRSIVIHTLVARTFLPNPNNYKYVRFKDGNKLNPSVSNLEWCEFNKTYKRKIGLKYKKGKEHGNFGIVRSQDVKDKQSAFLSGRIRFKGYFIINGEKYLSAQQAADALNVDDATIRRRIIKEVPGYSFIPKSEIKDKPTNLYYEAKNATINESGRNNKLPKNDKGLIQKFLKKYFK